MAFVALMWILPAAAEEETEDAGCCRAVGVGLPIAAVAEAVVTAGEKPLRVLPDDPTVLDFDIEGVCIEHLVNGLLREQKIRAKDCGDSYGLFGLDVPADKASCDKVVAPRSELPPGHLQGWSMTGMFIQRQGERMAAVSGPDSKVYVISGDANLSEGTRVEGLGLKGLMVHRGGVATLDGSLAEQEVRYLGQKPTPVCTVVEEIAPEEAAPGEGEAEEEKPKGPSVEDPNATPDVVVPIDAAPAEPIKIYTCEGLEPDFIQRPLPVELADDPTHQGKEVQAVVEFGDDGWTRKIVGVTCDEACEAKLREAIRDWRIMPVEVEEGTFGRVRVTIPFKLEIPCR